MKAIRFGWGFSLLLLLLTGCKDVPNLVHHNIDLGGAKHGSKLYRGAKDCTACHGINLNGQAYIPGCYDCHGVMWNNDDHLIDINGKMHKAGYVNAPSQCGSCHGGTSLKKANINGKLRPGCYDCHDDLWSALEDHKINKGGYLHVAGLYSPDSNCISCHGSDLKGGTTAPSCYSCHGAVWLYGDYPHNDYEDGVGHARDKDTPETDCVDCHGSDLKGSSYAPSCYKCHGKEWDGSGGDDKQISRQQALATPKP